MKIANGHRNGIENGWNILQRWNMNQNDSQLRAMVRWTNGWLEAKLVEIDIAVQGKSVAAVLNEIAYAITTSYEIAMQLGQTPFVGLLTEAGKDEHEWRDDRAKDMGSIELPEEVGRALAAALRYRQPIRTIHVFNKAA